MAGKVIRRKKDGVRLLGGEIKTKVDLKLSGASKSAVTAVEKAGGKVEIIKVRPQGPSKGKTAVKVEG